MGKGGSFEFQRIEFGEIQDTIGKMNFKDQFIAHGKIDFLDFTMIESRGSKGYVIYFGMAESAVIKNTIDKSNVYKKTLGKITIGKRATLKFLVIDFPLTINHVVVFDIKEIIGH